MPLSVCYIRRSAEPGENPLMKLRKWWRMPQQQDAFFEQSLRAGCAVTTLPAPGLRYLPRRWLHRFDALVVNAKATGPWREDPAFVRSMVGGFPGPKALFLGNAHPADMPAEEVADAFDLLLKREPYGDLERYPLHPANRDKIRPTLAGCPFGGPEAGPGCSEPEAGKQHDVFFAGRVNEANDVREQAWSRIVASGLDAHGGLHPRPRAEAEVPEALRGPRIKGAGYREAICRARINLALDGYGPVTARHLELWQAKAFMVSAPSLRDIWLHEMPVEGRDYVAFDDYDGLVDLLRAYRDQPEERRRIALAGGAFYARLYDPVRHGRMIAGWLQDPGTAGPASAARPATTAGSDAAGPEA
mgnify:FL=1